MKETGKVIRVQGNEAIVTLNYHGGCKSCGLHGVCTVTGTGNRELSLDKGPHKLESGDIVEIETPARSLLTASFLVFILPLIVSAAAYMVAMRITRSNGISLASFFAAFILTEGLVALIDRFFGKGNFFKPKIIQVLSPK
jgi:positive regulator of sigma E activity